MLLYSQSWQLGFRREKRDWSESSHRRGRHPCRVHGGIKARETSLAKGLAALVYADPF
ncbi:hypothetical protein RvVAR0630_20420 [Agrobacterium vitis]|nr:hypothetical protein RvVAR0630_20420 [Agrobacterium vitis]